MRSAIHAVPINKMFVFGADTMWPISTYAYATQTRRWLTHTLQLEIQDGHLTENEAMSIAEKVMFQNQYDCFARLHGPN